MTSSPSDRPAERGPSGTGGTATYPEHEKLAAVAESSQAIGEFLDGCDYTLCKFIEAGDNGEPLYVDVATGEPRTRGGFDAERNPAHESWDAHYRPIDSIQDVLAEFFGIDRDALEREKRAMLNALREANRAR